MADSGGGFARRSALITGAASGIGKACAHWLAARGIERLMLVDRNREGLDAMEFPCMVERHVADVANPEFWERLEPGPLDHAVVNAGISSSGPLTEIGFAEWRRVMSINLDGAFLSLQSALRAMNEDGSVVVTASAAMLRPTPMTSAYGSAKAALVHLARVAAVESAPRRIRVNAIAPGGVVTPLWDQEPMFTELVEQLGSREAAIEQFARSGTPLGRFASAEEVAAQIGFLLSDAAETITGAVLPSDGGAML